VDLARAADSGSNGGVSSSYRFSGPFVVRLMGLGLAGLGLVVVVLVVLVAVLSLPAAVLSTVLALAVLAVLALGVVALRRPVVVRFDDIGYRVTRVRGAGVRQAGWREVEDVAATVIAGERCVLIRLRDGRTTTVPVGILAGSPDDFVRDLQQHLDRGHGYRRVSPRPGS
jgi:hypothetical protein